MTIELSGPNAVADLLRAVADLVAQGQIVGISLTMTEDVPCRASVVFRGDAIKLPGTTSPGTEEKPD